MNEFDVLVFILGLVSGVIFAQALYRRRDPDHIERFVRSVGQRRVPHLMPKENV